MTLSVWQPCACGGVILAKDRRDVPAAIQRHQTEVRHLLWRIDNLKKETDGYRA